MAPRWQGHGVGTSLLTDAEAHVQSQGGRLLIISTSSTNATENARAFYLKRGYIKCGQIPDYYAQGDDKIIFTRKMCEWMRTD